MLKLLKRPGSPFWYVRGTTHGQSVYASTKEKDKSAARRFKDALEIRLARSAGQKCHAATFREAAALYLEAKPHSRDSWRVNIERLCSVIGDRLLVDIRQHVLVDAANALYPDCKPSSRNSLVFTPAAAVLHYAAENDLCPYIRVKKLKEKNPESRGGGREAQTPSRFLVYAGLANKRRAPPAMGGHRFNRGDGLVSHFQDR